MPELSESRNDTELLIFLMALLCSLLSGALLFSGLDVPAILLTCGIAAWTGVRTPRATNLQIKRGWVGGGIIAFLAAMALSRGQGGFVGLSHGHIPLDLFWLVLAVPAIGLLCAFKARKAREDGRRGLEFELAVLAILFALTPYVSEILFFWLRDALR